MSNASKKKHLVVDLRKCIPDAEMVVRCSLSATFNAAAIAQAFSIQGELDLAELIRELGNRCQEVHDGSLRRAENMLISQAHSLDAMFANLARRAIAQERLQQYEAHMKLALRAQNQCRATLETLAALKNPQVVFAKQANFANGPQQVNNEVSSPPQARGIENKPNELLELDYEQRLGARTTCSASGSNQTMATVEAVHRASKRERASDREPKRVEGRSASASPRRRRGTE